jgi:hypothetical protein
LGHALLKVPMLLQYLDHAVFYLLQMLNTRVVLHDMRMAYRQRQHFQ